MKPQFAIRMLFFTAGVLIGWGVGIYRDIQFLKVYECELREQENDKR